jgi:hypothetical protein
VYHNQGVLAFELEKLGSEALAHAEEMERRRLIAGERQPDRDYDGRLQPEAERQS